jgi:DNA end-binding protein Ku
VAIVKIAMRQRESLAALRIRDGVFVLETMLWPDEVREPGFGFKDENVEVRPQELKMAESLIQTMAGEFDPADYHDAYREALQQVIEAKVAGREIVRPEAPEEAKPAGDLMAALRASVEAAKREREGVPARERKQAAKTGEESEKAGKADAAEKPEKKRRTRKTA